MRVFNNLNSLPTFRKAVLTIGSFDGVHSGHQKILERVNLLAQKIGGESIVVTFHPHPRLVIYPQDKSLVLITYIDEKVALFEKLGIDNVVVVPFTVEFSQQSADEYIQRFLVEKFHPKFIVVGYDHRFGLNRQGDIQYLKWHENEAGYQVVDIEKQQVDDIAISSTKIRNFLKKGDVKSASKLLRHYFSLTGTVVKGQQIGQSIGFPTANIQINDNHKLIPPDGIYATFVEHKGRRYQAMLYIGNRPTLQDFPQKMIEVNIFDFGKDIYGDKIKIELVDFIREDAGFDNLSQLKAQLTKDKEAALKVLANADAFTPAENEVAFPTLAVVILNYNGKKLLENFLPFALISKYPNFKLYVADNGSEDHSIDYLKEAYPKVGRIDLKANRGFSKGYNLALKEVEAEYYVLLNSDVEVAENWISPIIELMERDQTIGVVQPKIKSYQNRDYFEYAGASGGWLDYLGYPLCRGRIFNVQEKDTAQYDDTQEIFWATGAAFFIRAQLFHAIGGFDEDHFAHWEEIDLCWRVKRAGYKVIVCPNSVVYHLGGSTLNYLSAKKTYFNFRNSFFTLVKNESLKKLFWLIPLRLLLDALAAGLFFWEGKFKHILAIMQAHWSFFLLSPKFFKKRSHYQNLIDKNSIDLKPNREGILKKSIIFHFFLRGKKYFKNL